MEDVEKVRTKPRNPTVIVNRVVSGVMFLVAMFWLYMSGMRLGYIMAIDFFALSLLLAIWSLQKVDD